MTASLLHTKFYVPPLRERLVVRDRLLQRLSVGLSGRLTLVSAPAGFGKTTLIIQSLQSADRKPAWLALDQEDDEPQRFLTYLIAAINHVQPDIAADLLAAMLAPNPPQPDIVCGTLLNSLAEWPQPLMIVLDDYHVVADRRIHDIFVYLIDHLPPHVHVIVTSRIDPPLPLPRWRVRGQLTYVNAADLRFLRREADIFLHHTMGLEIGEETVTTLEARTEGWVAGLQMAALMLQEGSESEALRQDFRGDTRYVADYLVTEVLEHQSPDLHDFLLRTSILNRMCASLCEAVLENEPLHAQLVLEQLERSNLFLIPLDNTREWYRYHHLFGELLQKRLQQEVAADEILQSHQRAARWFLHQELHEEAVHHALAASDQNLAAEILATLPLQTLWQTGNTLQVKSWVDSLSDEAISEHPRVALLALFTYFITENPHGYQRFMPMLDMGDDMKAGRDLIYAILLRSEGRYEEALALADQALSRFASDEIMLRCLALMQIAQNQQEMGNLDEAEATFRHMSETFPRSDPAYGPMYMQALWMRAALAITRLDLQTAAALCQQGLRYYEEEGRNLGPMLGYMHWILGKVHYLWHDLERSAYHIDRVHYWAQLTGISDLIIYSWYGRADLASYRGDADTVHQLMAEFKHHAAQTRIESFVTQALASEAHYYLRLGEFIPAFRWANACGIDWESQPTQMMRFIFRIYATVRLAEYQRMEVRDGLSGIRRFVERLLALSLDSGFVQESIDDYILLALVHDHSGDTKAAIDMLAQALDLAYPASLIMPFIDAGKPMRDLLEKAKAHRVHSSFVQHLLDVFGNDPSPAVVTAETPMVEALTERELEILHLIADGLSNKQIEDRLYISKNTVRTHIKNLYGKLEARSRTHALARARELGLIQ